MYIVYSFNKQDQKSYMGLGSKYQVLIMMCWKSLSAHVVVVEHIGFAWVLNCGWPLPAVLVHAGVHGAWPGVVGSGKLAQEELEVAPGPVLER